MDSCKIYINSFFYKNELYCVFSIDNEKVYVFKAIDFENELRDMMSKPFNSVGFNIKETIKNISEACNIYPNYYAKIKDVINSNYILEGGRSQKTNLGYLNDKYSKIKTSDLRVKYKLDEIKTKIDKMSYSELVEVKTEENVIVYSIYNNTNDLIKDQRSLYVENDLALILGKMEKNGFLINVKHLNMLKDTFENELKVIEKIIFDKAGKSFNINSPKQVGEVLFEHMGIPSKTKSTSEKVLKSLEKDNDIITDIFNYRSLNKLISTYIIGLLSRKDNNDRVHTTFNQALTSTGRLSSEDPNLQNIPIRSKEGKRIREAFIAEKGYRIVAIDYSQIELRILAILSGDKKLIEAFEKGLDIHRSTAAEIFDIAYEDVSVEQRRIAKSINFGLIYGLGAKNLAKELGITLKESKLYQEKYFSTYESIKPFFEKQLEYARENLHVCTYFNRKINTKDINTTNNMIKTHAERAANNASIQGTAADIIKLAMISVDGYMSSNRIDAKLLLQVHDELVFEVREDILEDFSKNISRLMENVISEKVPLIVESNFGDNWLEAH